MVFQIAYFSHSSRLRPKTFTDDIRIRSSQGLPYPFHCKCDACWFRPPQGAWPMRLRRAHTDGTSSNREKYSVVMCCFVLRLTVSFRGRALSWRRWQLIKQKRACFSGIGESPCESSEQYPPQSPTARWCSGGRRVWSFIGIIP